jgi:hypothetical protein
MKTEQPIDAYTSALAGEGATAPEPYSARVRCKSCENGSGPNGCTDCLNTGHDPMAFAGGIDVALNDAYAEGRKDERESRLPEWPNVRGCGSHHYTPDNIAAMVRDLKAVEEGAEIPEWINRDHRTHCGILWRVISALAHEVPLNPDAVVSPGAA